MVLFAQPRTGGYLRESFLY